MACEVVFLSVFWECDTQAVFSPTEKLLCNGKICISYRAKLHGIRKLWKRSCVVATKATSIFKSFLGQQCATCRACAWNCAESCASHLCTSVCVCIQMSRTQNSSELLVFVCRLLCMRAITMRPVWLLMQPVQVHGLSYVTEDNLLLP